MCESKVYMKEGDELKLIAEDVASMIPKEKGYILIDIAGRKYEVSDVVVEYIDFIQHKVVLKKAKQ